MRNKYSVEWLQIAKQDLQDIVSYLIDKAPLVALGIQAEFERQLAILADFPHLGQENAYFVDVFDFKVKGLPSVVAYQIFPEKHSIVILAVLHERQNRANPINYQH